MFFIYSPEGRFSQTTPHIFVSIIPLDSSTVPSEPDSEFVGSVYTVVARNRQGEPADIFYKNTEITVIYDPDDVRGLNEEDFGIDYYDETEEQWTALDSKVYPAVCKVVTDADRPAAFAVSAGTAPVTAVRKIDLRKNPNKLRHLFPNTLEGLKNTPVIVLDDYNELKVVTISEFSSNSGHARYRQYFRGVPLEGYRVNVALMSDGELKIRGTLTEGIDLHIRDVTPAFDEDTALASMKSRHRQDKGITADLNYRNERSELIIYAYKENAAYLAYEVSFFAASEEAGIITRPYFIFDAKTEEILEQWDGLTPRQSGSSSLK
ncbi:MAG: hypothetical protein GY795_25135 [Desulfobacterales bacterium]|nr:hypothetical protein [Desulfobacterales bacterium]